MGVGASGKLKSKYEEMMLALYLFVTEHTNTQKYCPSYTKAGIDMCAYRDTGVQF